ncbi:hypothetical protein D3C77_640040 [compost metagenome]
MREISRQEQYRTGSQQKIVMAWDAENPLTAAGQEQLMSWVAFGPLEMFLFMASDAVNVEREDFLQIGELRKQERHHRECDLHNQKIGIMLIRLMQRK